MVAPTGCASGFVTVPLMPIHVSFPKSGKILTLGPGDVNEGIRLNQDNGRTGRDAGIGTSPVSERY